jgi:hypothetical protein
MMTLPDKSNEKHLAEIEFAYAHCPVLFSLQDLVNRYDLANPQSGLHA